MAIRKGIYAKLCYNGKEMNISFQKEKKKEESVKMGYFGYLLSPLASAFNSDVGGPGQALWRMGGGGALDPRPSGATDMLCDLE